MKNRFNILYKKYREDVHYTSNVSEALNTVSKDEPESTEWIQKIITEKKKKLPTLPEIAESDYKPTITIMRSSSKAVSNTENDAPPPMKGRSNSSNTFRPKDEILATTDIKNQEEGKGSVKSAGDYSSSPDNHGPHENEDKGEASGESNNIPQAGVQFTEAAPILPPISISGEVFVNRATGQELIVTEQYIYIKDGMSNNIIFSHKMDRS